MHGPAATRSAPRARLRRLRPWIALGLVLAILGGGAAWWLFAPKPTSARADAPPEGTLLREGAFEGADGFHFAEGTVRLLRQPDGAHVLRFEGYDARSGPDVYFWLTPARTPGEVGNVEADGMEVRAPGGFLGGQATLRGDFNVPLPAGFDPDAYHGIVAWCNSYDVLFGFAPLAPAPA